MMVGEGRHEIGLSHERSGEIILLAEPDAWFAYPFWLDPKQRRIMRVQWQFITNPDMILVNCSWTRRSDSRSCIWPADSCRRNSASGQSSTSFLSMPLSLAAATGWFHKIPAKALSSSAMERNPKQALQA